MTKATDTPRKPSTARHGLLALASAMTCPEAPYFVPFAVRVQRAHEYGLDSYTFRRVLNGTVKAGLLAEHKRDFYVITDAGRAVLERYSFENPCSIERPCEQCRRSGIGRNFDEDSHDAPRTSG